MTGFTPATIITNSMITFLAEEYNPLSQSFYDSCINSIQFHQLSCSCGHSGCLNVHGYYRRKVKTHEGSFLLVVCRVKCSVCGKTHALLPSSMVPCSQIPLVCCCQVISAFVDGKNINSVCEDYPQVDENNVKSIILRYRKHWKERLLSWHIKLEPVRALIPACFSHYSVPFMQIRRTVNRIHPKTT